MKKLFVLGLLVACGTDSNDGPEVLPNLTIPAKPANGIQVLTPIVEDIAPTTDLEICTWTDAIVDKTTDVKSTLSFQTEPPGHHVVVFYTTEKQPPGTQRICTDTDMATFRFLTGNGGNGEINAAPENLVYRIPAGAQIVINHHYLNASDEMQRGQAVININFADKGNWTPSGNLAIVNSGLEVAPGVTTQKMHCNIDRDYKLWFLIPHMHRWGTKQIIDLTSGGVKNRLFDTVWDPSYTFHPPEMVRDPADPMLVKAGDSVDVECTWNNDTGHPLLFGFEMCVAFAQFVDDQNVGSFACDNGRWTTF